MYRVPGRRGDTDDGRDMFGVRDTCVSTHGVNRKARFDFSVQERREGSHDPPPFSIFSELEISPGNRLRVARIA